MIRALRRGRESVAALGAVPGWANREQRAFVEKMLDQICQADVPLGAVVVEITESVLMENLGEIGDKLTTLSDVGLLIALDDFGSGFSSFKYLADLPVAILKIDRTLLRGMKAN